MSCKYFNCYTKASIVSQAVIIAGIHSTYIVKPKAIPIEYVVARTRPTLSFKKKVGVSMHYAHARLVLCPACH